MSVSEAADGRVDAGAPASGEETAGAAPPRLERVGPPAPDGEMLWALAPHGEDLRTLAWLHAGEREVGLLREMHAAGFPAGLLLPREDRVALDAMDRALAGLADGDDDALRADFASIYLTHALRASPCESVWIDEDHLMLQAPTFEVRAFMRRHGLAAADWRRMPDDHLSVELEFLAALLELGEAAEARRFLDEHLSRWLPSFASAVQARAATPLYRALAGLTNVYIVELGNFLRTVPA